MIYRKAKEIKPVPIEHCMGGEGIVMMEKLLNAPDEMLGKGRAYVRHTLNSGVSIGMHTHEKEMETMVVVSGKATHIINGEIQHLEAGDIIGAMPGDTHSIACEGEEPLVVIAQVLYE
ncbi:cupin domain-containing protein [Fusobacterium varium]|uniref:cupin domain-containing protein n=1 Tax=Fusobacterium TaxID=848 RepID=UPI001032ACB7|nr:cupin domain-containing protein [Fusobacterium ulcerans]